jgi:multiple sugar transport system substrate-binding protein
MNAIEGLNWGLTYLPAWGEKNVIWGGSHNLAVFEKEHSPERLQAISTFIKWVSDHGADWAQSGQIPARIDVLESDEYKALPWSFAAEAIDRFIFAPPLVTASDITTAVDAYIYDYYLGNIPTAKEALDLAAAEGEAKAEGTLASMGAVD